MEYTYYGRHDGIKPKRGIADYMLTEYVRKFIDKEIDRFRAELTKITQSLKLEVKADIKTINKVLQKINDEINKKGKPVKVLKKSLNKKVKHSYEIEEEKKDSKEMAQVKKDLLKKGIIVE